MKQQERRQAAEDKQIEYKEQKELERKRKLKNATNKEGLGEEEGSSSQAEVWFFEKKLPRGMAF